MRQADIVIGGTYRVRIGSRLAPVTVLHRRPGTGRARYICETHDTRRQVTATAARLRPVPGTIGAEKEAARRAAVAPPRPPRAWSGETGSVTVEPSPVRGLVGRVSSRAVLRLSRPNAGLVNRAVDACHVAEPFRIVARAVRRRVGACVVWPTIPVALRRGILHAAAVRHAANRDTYCAVMRHEPLPSHRMVAEAVGVACGLGPMPR
jgi:hypothetical protein